MRQLGANISDIVHGYAFAGNHEKHRKYALIDLLDRYLNARQKVVDSSGKTKEYFFSFFSFFQKSYKQKAAAVSALKEALDKKSVDLNAHLSTLRNGTLGDTLRAFIKSGKANVLVSGNKVNTVTDFVQALQNKNHASNNTTGPRNS